MWKMATALNTTLPALEDELMQLILDGQIQARIDSHNKVRFLSIREQNELKVCDLWLNFADTVRQGRRSAKYYFRKKSSNGTRIPEADQDGHLTSGYAQEPDYC